MYFKCSLISEYVNQTVPENRRIDQAQYMRVITLMCNTMRNHKPYKKKR